MFSKKIFLSALLTCIITICYAQQNTPNDCVNAIEVCGSGVLTSNATGVGELQEVSGANSCSSSENNSLWLKIEIENGGILGFELRPTSPNLQVDYDFFVFGPNSDCNNLGTAIRCSTTNPIGAGLDSNNTGMNNAETDYFEGPGANGNSYVKSLEVQEGEIYYIVIDRPIGTSPFELKWTGTATENNNVFPEGPSVLPPDDLYSCNIDTISEFDLSLNDKVNTGEAISITYHETLSDAVDNNNYLPKNYISYESEKTIYIRVENEPTGCAVIEDFKLFIDSGPNINTETSIEVCDLDFNNYVEFNLSLAEQNVLSNLDGQFNISYHINMNDAVQKQNFLDQRYESSGETVYMRVEDLNDKDCFNIASVNLILNTPPEVTEVGVEQAVINANSNTLTISLDNEGYTFSINNPDGPFQESKTFTNVEAGTATLYIRDLNSCRIISTEIYVLGYSSFFTPNNDGYNDRWNIKGVSEKEATVQIFDRFGKLLKEFSASSAGWDGNYNGRPMPSNDYWFKGKLANGQEFSGHFTLKR